MKLILNLNQRKAFTSAFTLGLGAGYLSSNFRPVSGIRNQNRRPGGYSTDLERISGDFHAAIAKEKARPTAK